MATPTDPTSPVTMTVDAGAIRRLWWVPLVVGAAWLVLAMVILQFDIGSVRTISWLLGLVLVVAALDQLGDVAAAPGWRWLHAVLGVAYLAGGVAAFAWPDMTFLVAAHLLAWYLLLKGVTDIVVSLAERDRLQYWGALLAVGVLEAGVAFWAVGYDGRSVALLVLWVGFGAIAKGVTNILLAFELRAVPDEAAGAAAPAVPVQTTGESTGGTRAGVQ